MYPYISKSYSAQASLAVQNVDEFTLNVLVDFAYTGNVKVGLGNVRVSSTRNKQTTLKNAHF